MQFGRSWLDEVETKKLSAYIGNRTEVTLSFHAPQESIAGLSNSGCPAAPLEVQDSSKSNDLQMYKRLMGMLSMRGPGSALSKCPPLQAHACTAGFFRSCRRGSPARRSCQERAKWQALSRDTPKRGL